jgi:uncharacterized membrane protein YgcG
MPIMNVAGDKPMAEKHDGYSSSSLITQVRESPSKPGVIWIGTDDGLLQLSMNGGETFTNVFDNVVKAGLPKGYVQTARIEPSHFDAATAYVAFDNHRCCDDWKPYLFKTTDYGKSWTNVVGNLPGHGTVNALREDYDNPNLLFVGTEFGLYVTLDGGRDWKKFMTNLPSVRVDDILIHPRDRDLIIGTHGRSIWIADDISALEQLKPGANTDLVLFDPRPAILWKNDPSAQRHAANRDFKAQNPQGGTPITIWAKTDLGKGKVEFLQNDKVVSTLDVDLKSGMNRYQWPMRGPAPPPQANANPGRGGGGGGGGGGGRGRGNTGVPFVAFGGGGGGGGGFGRGGVQQGPLLEPGTFMIRLTIGTETRTSSVDILEDTWMRPQ